MKKTAVKKPSVTKTLYVRIKASNFSFLETFKKQNDIKSIAEVTDKLISQMKKSKNLQRKVAI